MGRFDTRQGVIVVVRISPILNTKSRSHKYHLIHERLSTFHSTSTPPLYYVRRSADKFSWPRHFQNLNPARFPLQILLPRDYAVN
jgi:hypothetical protein